VERAEQWLDSNESEGMTSAILISFFEPVECLLLIAETEIGEGKAVGRDIPLFGERL
jgi:hypothetical protein